MNLSLMLKSEQYQTKIYLNDRPYEVLDFGEGNSLIIIVGNIKESACKYLNGNITKRVILIDASWIIHNQAHDRQELERKLTDDIHLLIDVFWLEDVEVKSEIKGLGTAKIEEMLRLRRCSR